MAQHELGGAAEYIFAQARVAIGPHDDEVAAVVIGAAEQCMACVIAGSWETRGLCLDTVAGERLS